MMLGRTAIVVSLISTWAMVASAQTVIPAPEALSEASAHGLLALIASLSIGLAWWSMRQTFRSMNDTTKAITALANELRSRPCYYKMDRDQ